MIALTAAALLLLWLQQTRWWEHWEPVVKWGLWIAVPILLETAIMLLRGML